MTQVAPTGTLGQPLLRDEEEYCAPAQYHHYTKKGTPTAKEASYGELLYTMTDTLNTCCNLSSVQTKLMFYETIVIVERSTKWCCYPESYDRVAIPKYARSYTRCYSCRT